MNLLAAEDLFSNRLKHLKTERRETKVYITNLLDKYIKSSEGDFSNDSITLIFSKAKSEHNFKLYQDIADWLFFAKSFYPEHLNSTSPDLYNNIAQISYYKCYVMIDRQWILFEELSDRFVYLTDVVNDSISDLLPAKYLDQIIV